MFLSYLLLYVYSVKSCKRQTIRNRVNKLACRRSFGTVAVAATVVVLKEVHNQASRNCPIIVVATFDHFLHQFQHSKQNLKSKRLLRHSLRHSR